MIESEYHFDLAKLEKCHFTKGKWPIGRWVQIEGLNNNIYIYI